MATIFFLSAMMFSDQLVGLKIVIFSSFQVIDLFIDFNCVCFAMKLDPLSKSRISIVQA
jgi:hypothetical protein